MVVMAAARPFFTFPQTISRVLRYTIVAVERVKTGIDGLDRITNGGIPKGSLVLLVGSAGTGKTTLAMQFVCEGAKNGERTCFISITEPVEILKKNTEGFKFYSTSFVANNMMYLLDLRGISSKLGIKGNYTVDDENALIEVVDKVVRELKVKRLIIDSITAICQRLEEKGRIRDFIFRLGYILAESGCTTLMTSEVPPGEMKYSVYGVEEFISDGIIFMSEKERRGDLIRCLRVVKMRGTNHSRSTYMMDISENGITLAPMLKDYA